MNLSEAETRLRLSIEERALLYDLGRAINGIVDLDRLLPEVVSRTRSLFGVESSAIMLLDAATERALRAVRRRRRAGGRAAPGGRALPRRSRHRRRGTAATAQVEHVPDVTRDPRWYRRASTADRHDDALAALRAAAQPRWHHSACCRCATSCTAAFTDEDVELIGAVAESIAIAIDNARRSATPQRRRSPARRGRSAAAAAGARQPASTTSSATAPPCRRVFRLLESAAALAGDRPDHRRDRHRQGAHRARHPRDGPRRDAAVRRRQLRRALARRCSRASCSAIARAPSPAR